MLWQQTPPNRLCNVVPQGGPFGTTMVPNLTSKTDKHYCVHIFKYMALKMNRQKVPTRGRSAFWTHIRRYSGRTKDRQMDFFGPNFLANWITLKVNKLSFVGISKGSRIPLKTFQYSWHRSLSNKCIDEISSNKSNIRWSFRKIGHFSTVLSRLHHRTRTIIHWTVFFLPTGTINI